MSIELISPMGGEFYVSGSTMRIEWKSQIEPGEAPDNLQVFYNWAESSEWHYAGGPGQMSDIPQGHIYFTVPTVTEKSYLRIRVGLFREDEGTPLAYDTSMHVKILPSSSVPGIYLTDPQPSEDGAISLAGGSVKTIRWQTTGCVTPYSGQEMRILFTSSTGLPRIYELIATVNPCSRSSYSWTVPNVDTEHGSIRLEWGNDPENLLDWSGSFHYFTIYTTTPPNRPPVADAGPDQTVSEGALVQLTGAGSEDPDGDALTYQWARTDAWLDYTITLRNANTRTPSFTAPNVGVEPMTFIFRLTVSDGLLSNTDYVNVQVSSSGPVITSFSPRSGWFKTPVTLNGSNMGGSGVYLHGTRVATIPSTQESQYLLYLPDLPTGTTRIMLSNAVGTATSTLNFNVLPVPYQWDWGFPFHNPGDYALSWDDYERAFGYDAVYSFLCCDFNFVCQRHCHHALAQLLYDYYVQDMAQPGSCWGVSAASLKYFYGDYTLGPGETVRHLWFNLSPENEITRRIKALHICQLSAEVIDYLLDHISDTPVTMLNRILDDLDAGQPGIISIQNIFEGMDVLDMAGHALVPVHYQRISATETRIYVYDCNREELSSSRENDNPSEYDDITNWENYPYLRVISGATQTWEFEMAGGTTWTANDRFNITIRISDEEIVVPFSGFFYFPRSISVRNSYTMPASAEGIFMILSGSAEAGIRNQKGSLLGYDASGNLHFDIAGGIPIVPMGGASFREHECYALPASDYTLTLYGNKQGVCHWQSQDEEASIAILDSQTTPDSEDILRLGPGNQYLSLLSAYTPKLFSAKMIQKTKSGGKEYERTISLRNISLPPEQSLCLRFRPDKNSIVFANNSRQAIALEAILTQAMLGPQPEPPDLPKAEDAVLLVKDLVIPPGTAMMLEPSNWQNLSKSVLAQSKLEDTDQDGLEDEFEEVLGTDPKNSDSDGDRIPDGQELWHGLNPTFAGDASGDLDGDGIANGVELALGTNPNSVGGPFMIVTRQFIQNNQFVIQWLSVPGRTYQVEYTDALPSDKWLPLSKFIKATDRITSYSDPISPKIPHRSYRVRAAVFGL